MLLTFLSASVPLTKSISYSPRTGEYTVTSYPMVTNMTSEVVDVADMVGFAQQLDAYGRRGFSLMKGELDRPIVDESRAGRTVLTADHGWVCFDFDKVDCAPTFDGAVDAIYKYLPQETHDVDAVIQLSASCYHPRARRLSAHVFMQLSPAVDTTVLRDWLHSLNWSVPALVSELRLADSERAISYPLDSTVSSPAKLIYIAPPRCIGFTPPHSEAVQFLAGDRRSLPVPRYTKPDFAVIREKINELRADKGLAPMIMDTQVVGGQEFYKPDPSSKEEMVISDVRVSAPGHIRFNLNGGDSLAYYIDLKKPNIIGNFKGEPFMYTSDVAPKFYETLRKAAPKALRSTEAMSDGTEILAFYATNRGSAVHIGSYDRTNDVLRVDRSTTEAAYAWLHQMGGVLQAKLPHYDLRHDVTSDIRFEEGYPVINLFARTEFMKIYGNIERTLATADALKAMGAQCPVFGKVFMSAFAYDHDSILRFLNWTAYIFQTRKKPGTAWLLHGTEGTGKGVIFEYGLKRLFGEDQCVQVMMKDLSGDFNSLLEGKLLVMIDEAAMSKAADPVEMMARLRNWITESKIVINQKHRVEESVPNFANFIVAANDRKPIMITPGDRRWNIAPRQEERLFLSPSEVATLEQGIELPAMAQLLGSLVVNEDWLRTPVSNEAKKALFDVTHGMPDACAMATINGATDFFLAARPTAAQLKIGSGGLLPMMEYDALLRAMLDNTFSVATYNDLYVLFRVSLQDPKSVPEGQAAFRKMLRKFGFAEPTSLHCKRTGKTVYGFKVGPWTEPTDEFFELVGQLTEKTPDNVVSIRSA